MLFCVHQIQWKQTSGTFRVWSNIVQVTAGTLLTLSMY